MTGSTDTPRSIIAAVSPGDAYFEQVLLTADRLARGAPLRLLCIHPRPIEWVRDQMRTPESKTAKARREVARQIDADAARLGVVPVEVLVPLAQRANVGDDIVDQAGELGASTIVIGTHGRKGLDAWVVGSVAERVVQRADCGVCVVRDRSGSTGGTLSVVAAVCPDDASYTAVLRAAGEDTGGEPFRVVSLYVASRSGSSNTASRSPDDARDAVKRQIEADLQRLSLTAAVEVPVARSSNLGDDIVERARAARAGVIVVGTNGRTGLRRLLLGSVAEWVVRHAPCDVHVVRPPVGG